MSSEALTHQKGTITDAVAVVLPLAIGEAYLLLVGIEGDDFNSLTLTPELYTGDNKGVKARGELTVDTLPTVGDTFTIDGVTYTVAEAGDTGNLKVPVGADLAAFYVNIVAAINGTDGSNDRHPTVEAVGFISTELTLESYVTGIVGNAIPTTETFTAVTNIFDAATLGTATAGTDVYTNETSPIPTVGSSDSSGSPLAFAAPGMVYFDAGLPNLVLQPSGALTSVRYWLTKVGTLRFPHS